MATATNMSRRRAALWAYPLCLLIMPAIAIARPEAPRNVAITLGPDDVIPTGNDWLSLPTIRAADGAIKDINVISMRYRGLVEMAGPVDPATHAEKPLMAPFVEIDGTRKPLANLHWTMRDYWIPTGTMQANGLTVAITYVTPPDEHAAIIRFQITNTSDHTMHIAPGMDVSWGGTHRVTYSPEKLIGTRTMTPTPIDTDMQIFSYGTDDTHIAWGFGYVGSQGALRTGDTPGVTATHPADLAPGQSLDVHYLIGAGLEEYSAAYAMRVLNKEIDRYGIDGVITRAADDAHRHTRTTGQADLDLIMNRNLLFTTYYAWGRTVDTEDFIGVTSRSNRYYVSAAFWDRDALLWSFPGLLDTSPERAKDALNYVLGIQARNIGIHSRFIDGVVLEPGLELDELVAPILALGTYIAATHDDTILNSHADTIATLITRIKATRDPATGLYATFQDAQDEYIKKPFSISDNVLTWKALGVLADLATRAGHTAQATAWRDEAAHLKAAILHYGDHDGAPGAGGPIFAANVDATSGDFIDVPPGSLMKLPYLGFISEDDPLFQRTYRWLHSANHKYGFADQRYGLPGSYRLPFTTSWVVADHLRLKAGRARALAILKDSPWDGGIITEGVKPDTGLPDHQGLAFATAAGYIGHTICEQFCIDRP